MRWLRVLCAVWCLEAGLRLLALPGLRPTIDLLDTLWGTPATVTEPVATGVVVLLRIAVESLLTALAVTGVWWGASILTGQLRRDTPATRLSEQPGDGGTTRGGDQPPA